MYNALIIGAGQIAGGYDNITSDAILTHAHAYISNPQINLIGFYDKDYSKAEQMALKWHTNALKSIDEVMHIDIISICTPDNTHLEIIKKSLLLKPKIIFLEKPISNNIKEFNEIKRISKSVPILVNYTRRFVKEFQELSSMIKNGEFGDYQTGTGYYGKGFYHNGSHMKDLLTLLLGKINLTKEISAINDFSKTDLTKSVIINFDCGNFYMQGTNSKDFEIFELDLIFTKARIKILDCGSTIKLYKIKSDEILSDYKNLYQDKEYNTEMNSAISNAVNNIVQFLDNESTLISPIGEFL